MTTRMSEGGTTPSYAHRIRLLAKPDGFRDWLAARGEELPVGRPGTIAEGALSRYLESMGCAFYGVADNERHPAWVRLYLRGENAVRARNITAGRALRVLERVVGRLEVSR